jgi:hypothetical protein
MASARRFSGRPPVPMMLRDSLTLSGARRKEGRTGQRTGTGRQTPLKY